jgi:hypothetical protein
MTVSWDTAPRGLVEADWRSRDAYCLHYQGDEGIKHLQNVYF